MVWHKNKDVTNKKGHECQIPVVLSFPVLASESQVQSFDRAGIYLLRGVFLDIATLLLCRQEEGIIGMLRLLEICTSKVKFRQIFRYLQELLE